MIFVAPAVIWTMSRTQRRPHAPASSTPTGRGCERSGRSSSRACGSACGSCSTRSRSSASPGRSCGWYARASSRRRSCTTGTTPTAAIRDSASAANVSLPRTVLTQIVLTLITMLTGPLLAIFLLLLIPSRPLGLINYVSSVIFAFLYPFGVIGMTLLYFELREAAARPAESAVLSPGRCPRLSAGIAVSARIGRLRGCGVGWSYPSGCADRNGRPRSPHRSRRCARCSTARAESAG